MFIEEANLSADTHSAVTERIERMQNKITGLLSDVQEMENAFHEIDFTKHSDSNVRVGLENMYGTLSKVENNAAYSRDQVALMCDEIKNI